MHSRESRGRQEKNLNRTQIISYSFMCYHMKFSCVPRVLRTVFCFVLFYFFPSIFSLKAENISTNHVDLLLYNNFCALECA